MKQTDSQFSEEQHKDGNSPEVTEKCLGIQDSPVVATLEKKFSIETGDPNEATIKIHPKAEFAIISQAKELPDRDIAISQPVTDKGESTPQTTSKLPAATFSPEHSITVISGPSPAAVPRSKALLLAALLLVLILHATFMGAAQFIGAQGWAYTLGGPRNTSDPNLLKDIANQLHRSPTPKGHLTPQLTPQQYIDLIVKNMTLDQKLGQMMIVQFTGPDYGLDISTMISQYDVGAVLIFTANQNIESKSQLKNLIAQMQNNSKPIPLAVAIDQEGGTVDRLISLDGPRPSATAIGQTNDPTKAMQAGEQDARDLSYYGINLNLAPVVDVTNVYNSQLYLRTFGNNPTIVTKMADAYLHGLQQSGKVLGTLKHFPGLGDVSADPHIDVPHLYRSENDLESIDWVPYRRLIAQGDVQAIMVTHEIVTAIDDTKPSSLSYKIVTGILRNQLGFSGVIMTDSLTMEGITAYYTEGQAAALAVEAGSDLLMGAISPTSVAAMIDGIKQAINNGQISQQRIDASVRRILMLKYTMGLLHIPTL